MPSTTTLSSKNQSKTLKWAIQRSPRKNGKIQKVQSKSYSDKLSHQQQKKKLTEPKKDEMERLSSELQFTYDSLATIIVHFDSLQLAYTSSKPDLDKDYSATRLTPKEKELLAAYDDLGLQVVHLDRKIKKLEARLSELRNNNNCSPTSSPTLMTVSSPTSSIATTNSSLIISPPPSHQTSFFNSPPQDSFFECMDFFQQQQQQQLVDPNDLFLMDSFYYYPSQDTCVDPSLFVQ
ncbi:unnamed protein product [Cunninghamella echinulata]